MAPPSRERAGLSRACRAGRHGHPARRTAGPLAATARRAPSARRQSAGGLPWRWMGGEEGGGGRHRLLLLPVGGCAGRVVPRSRPCRSWRPAYDAARPAPPRDSGLTRRTESGCDLYRPHPRWRSVEVCDVVGGWNGRQPWAKEACGASPSTRRGAPPMAANLTVGASVGRLGCRRRPCRSGRSCGGPQSPYSGGRPLRIHRVLLATAATRSNLTVAVEPSFPSGRCRGGRTATGTLPSEAPPPHARRGAQSSCRPSEVPVPVSRRTRRGCRPATLSQTQQIARIRAAPPDPPPLSRRNSARGPPAHPSSSRRPAAVRSPRAPPRGQTPALLTEAKIVRRAGGRGPARPADFGQRPRLARPRRRAGTRHRRAPATASPSARCGPPPGASGRWRGRPAAQEAARPRPRRAGAAAAQRRRRLPLAARTLPPLRCVHTQGRPALGAIGGANQGGQRGRIGWGLMGGGVPPIAQ